MDLTIAHISDLHAGAFAYQRFESELDAHFIPWLEANHFDMLVIDGDLFDKRLPLDSGEAKAAIRLVFRVARLCDARGVLCRVVKGTLTHDYTQMGHLLPFEVQFPTFRVVQSACREEPIPGFKVLWIPEEYPPDYGEFYGRFFYDPVDGPEDAENPWGADAVYDAIFGHGEIDVAAGWSAMIEGERRMGGTPVHEADRLLHHCRGPVEFGHVHNRFRYKKYLGYGGSFSRWCHGEEAPKGFDVLRLSGEIGGTAKWKLKVEQVVNSSAPVYKTVRANDFLDISDAPDEIVRKVLAEAEGCARLRVKFESFPIGIEEYSIVRGAMVEDGRVDLVASARPPEPSLPPPEGGEVLTEENATEQQRAIEQRVEWLRDQSVPAQERLFRFIEEGGNAAGVTLEDVERLTAPATAT